MNNLKFIVTGTGRCGTVYMAKFLTSIGVPCCHEGIFNFESKSKIISRINNPNKRVLSLCSMKKSFFDKENVDDWVVPNETIADSSYLAVPYLTHPILANVPIIHVVRNPLDVISSFVLDFKYFLNYFPNVSNLYNSNGYENIIWETIPELSRISTPLERACWFYYRWNQIIEDSCKFKNHLFIRIEDFDPKILCDFVGGKSELLDKCFSDKKANTNKQNQNLSLESIPSGFFKNVLIKKANSYGYNLKVKKTLL